MDFHVFNMCIDIVNICFGMAHWQTSSVFDRDICSRHDNSRVLSFQVLFISERKNMLLVLIRIAFELRQF